MVDNNRFVFRNFDVCILEHVLYILQKIDLKKKEEEIFTNNIHKKKEDVFPQYGKTVELQKFELIKVQVIESLNYQHLD